MDNENKNNEQSQRHSDNKRHYPKHRGYFLKPNAQGNANGEDNPKNAIRQQDTPPTEQGGTIEKQAVTPYDGEERAKRHRNRHRNKQKHKHPNAETSDMQMPNAEAQSTVEKSTALQRERQQHNENNRKQKNKYERPQQKPSTDINDEGYEQVRFPAVSSETDTEVHEPQAPVPMIEVVGVRFKSSGKTYYFAPNGKKLRRGEHAIVETARGLEYGDVAMGNTMVKESDTVPPLRPVIRAATPADIKHHEENKKKEDEAFVICNEKIIEHKLDMKLIDAQFTFDNSKLLFYFTSSGRVDFRDLVKDLAGVFRTRIELRQIGIRDEAKIMGGVGMCGRPLCCTLFLSDFGQVSIKMAKEQNLSLNCAKISGICGRLMCCLKYEHETYEYEIKRTPPVDSLVQTADGTGTVTEISPLLGTVKVRLSSAPEQPPKVYKREDIVMLQRKNTKNS